VASATYQTHPLTRFVGLRKTPTRSDRYLALLRNKRQRGRPPGKTGKTDWPDGLGWVSLPEIQPEAGAQHGARKQELEQRGHKIENVMLRQPNGECWSWYRLVYDAEQDVTGAAPISSVETLFGDLRREHRDD
jgi:hypothetical protein